MSIENNVSQSYPGPDDDDPPFHDAVRPEKAPHPFKTQADVDHLVRVDLWGPAEATELERRRKTGEWPKASGLIQWLTTAPNPRAQTYGPDGGQRGWRQHAVKADATERFSEIGDRPAACGLLPAHGWSLDLFAREMRKCVRCRRALGLACPKCRGTGTVCLSETTSVGCPDCGASGDRR